MRWTLEEVAGALGVAPPAGLDPLARLVGVSIDSRTVAPGELFIAIHGPRHDGHSFVAAALAAGASAAVVARDCLPGYGETVREKLFAVQDTLAALQQLALAVRRRWGKRLVGVTGSVGKTTTKEILAALLAARFRVLKSEGNLNNEYGLPLTLLGLDEAHEAAVVELGMSHRGELARLAQISEPDVGVVVRVAPVHLEFFSSLEEVALAKRELIEGLAGAESVAVLNADDERVREFAEVARGRALTFGLGPRADFRAERIEDRGTEGSVFDFIAPREQARLELRLVGRHNVSNALAALAAASVWGVGVAEARVVLPRLEPARMRGETIQFEGGFALINDCYNSNPVALDTMVNLVAATPGYRRRILVAGEMLELGESAAEFHRAAGRSAVATGKMDWIFGVQGEAIHLVRGAVEAGHPESRARFFATSPDAAPFLADFVAPGDLLLVKGSRGVHMEHIVDTILARHARKEQG
ncbi:MAG TPA: UDP-N-acetylmuramoyl-tripeptide--D-alanyl-D-alanine ligase [Candidatus Acidoferrales bacterium]|nr:UDP-N-acetylmuramoyl-tripeptide--D-alanyl-D-alanine ligase [Candidatus Acidoferrales bacterium]